MTSYGQGAVEAPVARIFIELHTVNKKNLEIHCHLPRQLRRFDPLLRSHIAKAISCGQVTLHLQATFHDDAPVRLAAHLPFAKQLQSEYEKIATHLGLPNAAISLDLLARHEDLWAIEENQSLLTSIEPLILQALTLALDAALSMKRTEGEALKRDLLERVSLLKKLTHAIKALGKDEPARYKARLEELYEKLKLTDDERVLKEIALFAEKIDIAEELTRLLSHLDQFTDLLATDDAVGKTLDFLSQEIQREVNTIASKSQNIEITRLVVGMKTEISRIREQVLNVE